jgi:hypothetical protein
MIDNSKKLDELESKMSLLEQTLNEIKAAIREKKEAEPSDDGKTSIERREALLPKSEQAKIHSVMRNFDFQKVHDIMKSLDWKWAYCKDGTPSVEELKTEAHRLLVDACEEETYISTGGFRAVYEKEADRAESGDPYIGLEFIVEECEGYEEDDDNDWVE